MNEFKLCEEMGLEVLNTGQWTQSIIKASDVEAMLQHGHSLYPLNGIHGISSGIILTKPENPKPVSKAEIIKGLKDIAVYGQESGELRDRLVSRLEKAGLE